MIALRLVGRLVFAAFGLFLAGFAVAATVYFGLRQLYAPSGDAVPPAAALHETGLYVFATALALGRFPLLVAAAAIILAEAARLRAWPYYAAAGLLCGAYALTTLGEGRAAAAGTGGREAVVFIAAGLAGGLVYWLVAGRSAGIIPGRAAPRRAAPGSAPAAAEHRRAGDKGIEGGP